MASKVDPRKVLGTRAGRGGYLNVVEEEAVIVPEPEERHHGTSRHSLAWVGLLLVWVAALSAAVFFCYVGVLPALIGATYSEVLVLVLASPVLLPCLARLLPFLQRRVAELKGTNCYMWLVFVALWCALLAIFVILWELGVMQVVIGVIFSQAIMVVLALLLLIPCLVYTLPMIKEKLFAIPGYIKRKLWEIPPLILPLFENMIKGLLHEMEQRILEKLKDLPKDVAKAVFQVGGNVVNLGKKGLSKARGRSPAVDLDASSECA